MTTHIVLLKMMRNGFSWCTRFSLNRKLADYISAPFSPTCFPACTALLCIRSPSLPPRNSTWLSIIALANIHSTPWLTQKTSQALNSMGYTLLEFPWELSEPRTLRLTLLSSYWMWALHIARCLLHFLYQLLTIITVNNERCIDWCNNFGNRGSQKIWQSFLSLIMWTLVFKRGFKHLKCYTNDVFSFSAAGNLAFHSSYIQPLDALRTGHHLTAMGQDRFTAQGYQTNLRHNHTLHQIQCRPKLHDHNHDSHEARITHWSLPSVCHPWETVSLGPLMAHRTHQLGP